METSVSQIQINGVTYVRADSVPTGNRAARRPKPKPSSLKICIAEAIVKGDKRLALSLLDEAMTDD